MTEPMADSVTDTTVADAPVADSPASEDAFDALLREFDEGTDQPANQPRTDEAAAERDRAFAENMRAHTEKLQLDSKRREVEQAQEYLRTQEDAHDEAQAFKQIRGDLDVDDEEVLSFVLGRSLKDPAINQLWQGRRENRAAYDRMVAKLHGELEHHEAQRREKILRQESAADHFAVAQSLRGQGGRVAAEPPPDFSRMSNREFQQWKNENMRP